MYLMVAARRNRAASVGQAAVYQSDYAAAWTRHRKREAPPAWVPAAPQRRNALHKLWRETNDLVERTLHMAQQVHPLLAGLFETVGWPPEAFHEFVRHHQRRFESDIITASHNPYATGSTPAVTHRIWVTTRENGVLPPGDFLAEYLKSAATLPSEAVHYFWTNSPAVEAHVARLAATGKCANVVLMDIDLFEADPLYRSVAKLLDDKKYVLAADVLKFLVLHRFGGIYSDLGVIYDKNIFDLAQAADYSFLVWDGGFFQTSFVACPPRADLIALFLAVLNLPEAFSPSYSLIGKEPVAQDEVRIFAGAGFTALAMLFLPPLARALIVPPQSPNLRWRSQQSWYGEAKHGNVIISETAPSILQAERFGEAAELISVQVRKYGDASAIGERLRILILTRPYFERNPTPFCQIFYFHGSDKALAWHNYGYIYNYLLRHHTAPVRTLLEVGIRTNNLDVPSTMGATGVPGASLRTWREAFPRAAVIGADIDDRILFQEEGIETYFVDQTKAETIARLFQTIGQRPLDLIVDDGLHTFHGNRMLLEGAYKHLAPGGLYVIEDVPASDVPAWDDYLTRCPFSAVMVEVPSNVNRSDNRLIFIVGTRKDRKGFSSGAAGIAKTATTLGGR